jgi:hypothetical protein
MVLAPLRSPVEHAHRNVRDHDAHSVSERPEHEDDLVRRVKVAAGRLQPDVDLNLFTRLVNRTFQVVRPARAAPGRA